MSYIGFSTGALALDNVDRALTMLQDKRVQAIELSALRQHELLPLIERLGDLDLSRFTYKSFHAPSFMSPEFESTAINLLQKVRKLGWPIIVHPDAMHAMEDWACFGELLCIENMDKRKPVGQTAADLHRIFDCLPIASLCLDLGHARQVDPTMTEAIEILLRFPQRLRQLHVSEVNAQSKHAPLTLEASMAFRRVANLIPPAVPIILESRVEEGQIESEIVKVREALNPAVPLAVAGD
jgi:hypothetical protein